VSMINVVFLYGTTRVGLSSNRITYTPSRLVCADIIRKVVIERTKLIGAIITHPRATGSRRHRELNAIIHRCDTHLCVVLMRSN